MVEPLVQRKGYRHYMWRGFVHFHGIMTTLTYPLGAFFLTSNRWKSSAENARFYWQSCLSVWLPVTTGATYLLWKSNRHPVSRILARVILFYMWDAGLICFSYCGYCVEGVLTKKKGNNRLFHRNPKEYHGNKIVILGNGPSLAKNEPLGAAINAMDEVVRFNNFQTKISGLEEWTGTKTTIHFSDSMLYPSYPEYKVPGATICLSLFMDRLMVSGSYFLFRMGIDLAFAEATEMMFDDEIGWISNEDIEIMKKTLNISMWKHPTSGCLAIDWFSRNRPDKNTPVYIHGFDFFQGDQLHYYSKTEPLYERVNDLLGVNMMHEPHKEKAFVERLVAEGHVKWLKDAVLNGDMGPEILSKVKEAADRVQPRT